MSGYILKTKFGECMGEWEGAYLVKGHVSSYEALNAIEKYEGFSIMGGHVSRLWIRWVPDSTGEFTMRICKAKRNTRGSFPVTQVLI